MDVVGGDICVSPTDGGKVYDAIKAEVQKGSRVKLSFFGVTRLTTAFLNAAIGQLYGEFSEEKIRHHLAPPVDMETWQLNLLKLATDRAKSFFRNPSAAKAAFVAVTGIEDDEDD